MTWPVDPKAPSADATAGERVDFRDAYRREVDKALSALLPREAAHEVGLFAVYLVGKAAARRDDAAGLLGIVRRVVAWDDAYQMGIATSSIADIIEDARNILATRSATHGSDNTGGV